MTEIKNKMPKPETLRKYYPDNLLSDAELVEMAEWTKNYLGKEHISPDNRLLKVLIEWEETQRKKRGGGKNVSE